MYLSRVQLHLEKLKPDMLQKWRTSTPYASHQWLWQLFPEQQKRHFLFRQEPKGRFFILSATPPLTQHFLFEVETKPFKPSLEKGLTLDFQLRANPVVTHNNKRSDVMMDAKYKAKANGIARDRWWKIQQRAAQEWLENQGNLHGFRLIYPDNDDLARWAGPDYADDNADDPARSSCVGAYQQYRVVRRLDEKPIAYSSVDYAGSLCITDVALFEKALLEGIGKCKGLGCGLMMVRRKR
ncbi:type I-E CRISPR-associated protein Cas6/Cse3/CasE [Martelella alba]|uniref:Type I-E CRISPR-associated protein Cas6/Cse3/CasE n=1 Tax=Martelella alba TaxID=2590451 RepID=A0ABY2SL13_9HYPH|nr:type I-E CRISPR-associated protein Cas6/Cse3/CasE [Martelella alba]TKI04078.1 type I-E CRISPR-associated protein Cas6/Cse3/CasE [Martelella alba]